MTAKRILVSAYGCEPGKGSELGVGWHWVIELARSAELVVITRSNNAADIAAALPAELSSRVRFEYYDLPPSISRFKRKEKGLYFYYILWQWKIYGIAARLVKQEKFDYVMHLTFGSIWMPTFLHRLPVPFIWGPVGGGEAVPFRMIGALPAFGRITQYLRYVLMATFAFNPLVMGIVRRSRIILARTDDTAKVIPARYAGKVQVILETAINDEVLEDAPVRHDLPSSAPLKAIFTGRLVALKNVALAIHAVARARAAGANVELTIVGDGPLRSQLKELAKNLGVADYIKFHGVVTRDEVFALLKQHDVYVFPSLKEGGVWSLMEAMAMKLPVICVKASGMEVITDDASAIRVAPVSQEQLINEFSDGLLKLANSPELRRQLGENARQRIDQHFRWRHKGDFMATLLNQMENSAR